MVKRGRRINNSPFWERDRGKGILDGEEGTFWGDSIVISDDGIGLHGCRGLSDLLKYHRKVDTVYSWELYQRKNCENISHVKF